jgi:hypothetical protein
LAEITSLNSPAFLEVKVRPHWKVVDIADIYLKVTLRSGTGVYFEDDTPGCIAVTYMGSIVAPTVKRKDGRSAVIDKPTLQEKTDRSA